MNRADRIEAALRRIVDYGAPSLVGNDSGVIMKAMRAIAQEALDTEYPWPGDPLRYNAPEDFAIAKRWMEKHEKADELIFVHGRPVVAMYYEPVAEHYQGARRIFRRIAETLRTDWESYWWRPGDG